MFKFSRSYKRLSIWILLFVQILLILSYIALKVDNRHATPKEKISFITINREEQPELTYHTINSKIFLKSISTRECFMDFNSSLCYLNGTDVKGMQRTKDINWQCKCLPGWHGKDCGQPEVIWRAFLTYKKPIKLTGPRTFQRRLIYIFPVDKFTETITEIRISELAEIVDLFVLYENTNCSYLQHKLDNAFLHQFQQKIIYMKTNELDGFLHRIKNVRDDDIVLRTNSNTIPNKFALNFLKYYDKWPQPIRFRLRWSVYGFYWVHPMKTTIVGGACSIAYFRDSLNSKVSALGDNKTLGGIILGDLNHFGGWFCDYCYDISLILRYLQSKGASGVDMAKIRKIDAAYLEDAIENGLYIDGKTELIRARRYSDNYLAPFHVMENHWKYDYLLINFYSKIDYYEG